MKKLVIVLAIALMLVGCTQSTQDINAEIQRENRMLRDSLEDKDS